MSSRKIGLTHTLIAAAKNRIYDLIEPLVAAGADVNGFPEEEDFDATHVPLDILVHDLYVWLVDEQEPELDCPDDYMLTFHNLFKCGANGKCLDNIMYTLFDTVYISLGLSGLVLFLQYDVKFRYLNVSSEDRLSALRAICYNGGIYCCNVTHRMDLLKVITTGLLKEFLMLVYDNCDESHSSEMVLAKYDKVKFLLCAQDKDNLKTVEYTFSIDFVIVSF